jgi:small ligand-binding sensory domain FIST
MPIGPVREITKCHDDIALEIDGRPAYEVFAEDIGPVMKRSLSHTGGYIFAGFPLPGSERQDYLLREITGLDAPGNRLRIAAHLSPGRRIMFCRRDPYSALADLDVMLEETRDRLIARGARPRGALYFSCTGRGAPMFGSGNAELETVSDVLGESVPVIGFYANGEVSANHLYGYSAVIALFGG